MKNLTRHFRSAAAWDASPFLHINDGAGGNEYRLEEGRIEFRVSGRKKWRTLAYSEIHQHMILGTAVAKWVSQLYTTAKLAKALAD